MPHTKGPWKTKIASWNKGPCFGFSIEADGKDVFVCSAGVDTGNKALIIDPIYSRTEFYSKHFTAEEVEANAHLIGASPEMYDALQASQSVMKHVRERTVGHLNNAEMAELIEAIEKNWKAIKKAEGEK